ncbi:MAG TPA: hypothetical protein VL360_01175 [Gammaproteobacteria bacterium]|jgi:hypothetical protein|nr:hypothetical protein [Gammaproteobacteria bacterium]
MFTKNPTNETVEFARNMFDYTYGIASDEVRDPVEIARFKMMAYNLDAKYNGTRPITKLAAEGNHRAVEFLISCGSNIKYAVKGYLAAGYFLSDEKANRVLSCFKNNDIKKRLVSEALEQGCSLTLLHNRELRF